MCISHWIVIPRRWTEGHVHKVPESAVFFVFFLALWFEIDYVLALLEL